MTKLKHGESFGLKQLEKYGWTEGKGLGAQEEGMRDALRPSLKFDKHGLGHDIAKDIAFNWWDSVFNKALDTVGKSSEEITGLEKKKKEKKRTYSNFVKKTELDDDESESSTKPDTLSNEMVSECEGRTAHKGARHGIYCSGKLERVKRAEQEFLRKVSADGGDIDEKGKTKRLRTKNTHSNNKSRTNRRKRTK